MDKLLAKSPLSFVCPVCNEEAGFPCRAIKSEIIGAISRGMELKGVVHSGRYLLAINPALGKVQEMPIGDLIIKPLINK